MKQNMVSKWLVLKETVSGTIITSTTRQILGRFLPNSDAQVSNKTSQDHKQQYGGYLNTTHTQQGIITNKIELNVY